MDFHQYSLMRVTQTERPLLVPPTAGGNDENDPLVGNVVVGEKEGRMLRLRREYVRKMAEAESRHGSELLAISKQHQQQINSMAAKHRRELAEKEEYIQQLEELLKPSSLQNTQPAVNLSSYVHTEHSRVPHYQQISGSIDFKLQPRTFEKQLSLDGRLLAKRKITTHSQCHNSIQSSKESSKHKLIPKEKPSEPHSQDREDYWHHNVKIARPFFL